MGYDDSHKETRGGLSGVSPQSLSHTTPAQSQSQSQSQLHPHPLPASHPLAPSSTRQASSPQPPPPPPPAQSDAESTHGHPMACALATPGDGNTYGGPVPLSSAHTEVYLGAPRGIQAGQLSPSPTTEDPEKSNCLETTAYVLFGFISAFVLGIYALCFLACECTGLQGSRKNKFLIGWGVGMVISTAIAILLVFLWLNLISEGVELNDSPR